MQSSNVHGGIRHLEKARGFATVEKLVPFIPPDTNKDPVEYNLYETKVSTCEDLMKDRAEREAAQALPTDPPPQQTANQ